jgi:hypothetical protein
MDVICSNDIKRIIQRDGGAHVSIFMPTHHKGGVDQQDPVRLKNLLRTAEQKLVAKGMRAAEARVMLKPAEGLLTDNLFWRQQSDGLALFIDPGIYLYYRVPIAIREEVGVGERFNIKPLVSLLSDCGWYYVLAISQDEIRLLQCTRFGSLRINLDDLPKNMSEALKLEMSGNRIQYHVPAPAGGSNFGGSTAIQTGESSRPDYVKRNIMQYLDQISKGIKTILKEETAPMILAAVNYLHPMYHTANTYRYLLSEGILGNPEGVIDDILREQAWKIVSHYIEKTHQDAVADYNKSAGTGLTANGLNDVIPAAYHGRVRFLFMEEGAQQWGNFNAENNTVTAHSQPEAVDEDLVELAAFQTLEHAGTVYVMKHEAVPGGAPVSAILRF